MAAVLAVRALVPCGASDAVLPLTAFQDPHYVPVRAFYEPCTRVNYCARLAVDNSLQARTMSCASARSPCLQIRGWPSAKVLFMWHLSCFSTAHFSSSSVTCTCAIKHKHAVSWHPPWRGSLAGCSAN